MLINLKNNYFEIDESEREDVVAQFFNTIEKIKDEIMTTQKIAIKTLTRLMNSAILSGLNEALVLPYLPNSHKDMFPTKKGLFIPLIGHTFENSPFSFSNNLNDVPPNDTNLNLVIKNFFNIEDCYMRTIFLPALFDLSPIEILTEYQVEKMWEKICFKIKSFKTNPGFKEEKYIEIILTKFSLNTESLEKISHVEINWANISFRNWSVASLLLLTKKKLLPISRGSKLLALIGVVFDSKSIGNLQKITNFKIKRNFIFPSQIYPNVKTHTPSDAGSWYLKKFHNYQCDPKNAHVLFSWALMFDFDKIAMTEYAHVSAQRFQTVNERKRASILFSPLSNCGKSVWTEMITATATTNHAIYENTIKNAKNDGPSPKDKEVSRSSVVVVNELGILKSFQIKRLISDDERNYRTLHSNNLLKFKTNAAIYGASNGISHFGQIDEPAMNRLYFGHVKTVFVKQTDKSFFHLISTNSYPTTHIQVRQYGKAMLNFLYAAFLNSIEEDGIINVTQEIQNAATKLFLATLLKNNDPVEKIVESASLVYDDRLVMEKEDFDEAINQSTTAYNGKNNKKLDSVSLIEHVITAHELVTRAVETITYGKKRISNVVYGVATKKMRLDYENADSLVVKNIFNKTPKAELNYEDFLCHIKHHHGHNCNISFLAQKYLNFYKISSVDQHFVLHDISIRPT